MQFLLPKSSLVTSSYIVFLNPPKCIILQIISNFNYGILVISCDFFFLIRGNGFSKGCEDIMSNLVFPYSYTLSKLLPFFMPSDHFIPCYFLYLSLIFSHSLFCFLSFPSFSLFHYKGERGKMGKLYMKVGK